VLGKGALTKEDMMKDSFKTALIAAVVSAFVAAGAAVATTKTFVLGTTNTVDAASTVTAGSGLNTKILQFTNNSTGSSATALGLTTPSSRPPMIVSSDAKVTKLNADELDGIDSAGFMKGRGTALANRIVVVPPTSNKALVTIPGLGYLSVSCSASLFQVRYTNDTGGNVDMWFDTVNSHFDALVWPSGPSIGLIPTGGNGATLALGVGNDPGARRTALLHVFAFQSADGAPCDFQVQGMLWTS
jgi:hypothetical protein